MAPLPLQSIWQIFIFVKTLCLTKLYTILFVFVSCVETDRTYACWLRWVNLKTWPHVRSNDLTWLDEPGRPCISRCIMTGQTIFSSSRCLSWVGKTSFVVKCCKVLKQHGFLSKKELFIASKTKKLGVPHKQSLWSEREEAKSNVCVNVAGVREWWVALMA